MTPYQPIFATRQALRIAAVRQLLTGAGIAADPKVVYPEDLERTVAGAGNCLVMVDAQPLPEREILLRLRRSSPGSRIVLWTDRATTDQLQATMECDLHGLISSLLPPAEAACALLRICRGERLLRFDANPGVRNRRDLVIADRPSRPVAEAPSFDAQWMLDGADTQGRET